MACVLAGAATPGAASAAVGDWRVGVPVFTPKSGTSFTLLFSNFQPHARQFQIRRYDAVGTLLTNQTVTIGANGTLQASPAAHSGAPLTVQLWTDEPGLTVKTTYTDSGDVSRVIDPSNTVVLGPADVTADAFQAGLTDLQGRFAALTSPLDALQAGVTAVNDRAGGLASGVTSANEKLDALGGKVSGSAGPATPAADPRIDKLQKSVAKMRKQVAGLRKLLVRALKRRS